jgi:hypothetical protein
MTRKRLPPDDPREWLNRASSNPALARKTSADVLPIWESSVAKRRASRSNRTISSAFLRLLMGPSRAYSTRLGGRPDGYRKNHPQTWTYGSSRFLPRKKRRNGGLNPPRSSSLIADAHPDNGLAGLDSLRGPVSRARTVQLPKSSDHAHDGRLDSVGSTTHVQRNRLCHSPSFSTCPSRRCRIEHCPKLVFSRMGISSDGHGYGAS